MKELYEESYMCVHVRVWIFSAAETESSISETKGSES